VDPKVNLSYNVNSDVMTYATVAEGFRPGGGNAQYPVTGAYWSSVFAPYNFPGGKWPSSYKSDSVWNYEIGTKAEFLKHRLEVDASVYYEDWQNIQLLAEPGDWALNINGRKAEIAGGDIDTRALLGAGFTASLSVGYTHVWVDPGAHWEIVPGNVLPDVPQWNGNASISYSRPLSKHYTFTARAENSYVGSHRSLDFLYGFSTNGEYALLPSYDLTNFRVGIESMREGSDWSFSLFVNNAFNKQAKLDYLFQETLPAASFDRVLSNQPLTAGADVSYRF
jgi:outer membrane receptor protein involved in Fe transport